MKAESTFKIIKVYCYEHQTTFEISAKPHIICTIEEHSLSNGFPNAEFWEFCCDCETFFPSKSDVSGEVLRSCPNCDRSPVRRFVCQNCNIAAFESDEPSRGKTYHLTLANGIQPNCPGCIVSPSNIEIVSHDCKSIDVKFLTARKTCPFCLEQTVKAAKHTRASSTQKTFEVCPQCQSRIVSGSAFCSKCKYQLRSDIGVEKLGTDISRTQLLGSLCPNCSTSIPADSEYCGECGQAVVKAIPPPPPPPPKKKGIVGVGEHAAPKTDSVGSTKPVITKPKARPTFKVIAAAGAGLAILIVIVSNMPKLWQGGNQDSDSKNKPTPSRGSPSPVYSPSQSSPSSLANTFSRNYQGTINGKAFSMSLVKDGSDLKGSASAGRHTDTLSGTIDSNGEFHLDGYENGTNYSGIYSGRIYNDGTISGNWTMTDGTHETSFSLAQK